MAKPHVKAGKCIETQIMDPSSQQEVKYILLRQREAAYMGTGLC